MRRSLLAYPAIALALLASIAPTSAATPTRLSEVRGVDQAEFSADAMQVLVSTKEEQVSLWITVNGSPIKEEITGPGQAFVMSADSQHVLISLPQGGARIFNPATGMARSPQLDVRLRIPAHPEAVFAPNGQQVLIFEPGAAAIFAVATGQRVATLSLRAKPAPPVATKGTKTSEAPPTEEEEEDLDIAPAARFTRDGARCFVMTAQGVVTTYDTATWKALGAPMRHPAAPSAYSCGMALSEDGAWMATFDEPGENGPKSHLQVWDAIKGKPIGKPAVAINGISGEFVPGSSPRLLVTSGRGEASIRELPSYRKIAAIPAHDEVDGPSVALSPDGKWALSWGSDRVVRLQATGTGAVQESQAFQATISQVLMLPDSTGCLVVFDNSAFLLQDYYDHYVLKLSFPDLKVSQSVRLTEYLHRAVLSPDGKRFLLKTGSTEKERVTVYEITDFRVLAD